MSDEKRHPIQVVSRRSGLSLDVLRAWEKRYGLVTPARSAGGRRLYSDSDVDRLRLAKEAVAAGRRVGKVAQLELEDLRALVEEDRHEAFARAQAELGEEEPCASPEACVAACLDAVTALDADRLKSACERAMFAMLPMTFVADVATPLMHKIGDLWYEGRLTPAHEHLASSIVRTALAEVTEALQPPDGAPELVVATPAGQRHEIAAVLVSALAELEGWHVTYVGSDLPATDIARAAEQKGARAVALSVTYTEGDPQLESELRVLRLQLASEVSILIGGQASESYSATIESIGATQVPGLPELRKALRGLSGSAERIE